MNTTPENVECQTCGGVDTRYVTFQTSEPCPDCGGEGVTEPDRHDHPDHGLCPTCGGLGRVKLPQGPFWYPCPECQDGPTPENVECPTCGGDGLRTERWMDDNEPFGDGWQGYHPPCPDCDGTGEVSTPENVDTPSKP